MGFVTVFILVALVYLAPVYVAMGRRHRNAAAIAVVVVLLGWTFIGWAVALAWSFTDNVIKDVP